MNSNLVNENLGKNINLDSKLNDVVSGVSIENASYFEKNNLLENENEIASEFPENFEEEYTPQLFSEEASDDSDETNKEMRDGENHESDQLFDQDINEEDDFEIPAFLRKQKF